MGRVLETMVDIADWTYYQYPKRTIAAAVIFALLAWWLI